MSKARVAPLKQLTIPKLELMAAVIGARLMTHLLQSVPTKTFYLWSDSQIVLHWLTTNRKLKTFERNRVTEIQELTESRKWNYCSTDQNPADLLTRGIAAHEYLKSKLWKNGPDWLTDERNFPSLQLTTENAILLRPMRAKTCYRPFLSKLRFLHILLCFHPIYNIYKFQGYILISFYHIN